MKIGLKEKELQLNQEVLDMNNINTNKSNEMNRNNDQSSTKEDENYMVLDDPIEYCSSPKIGLVSKHWARNKNNRFFQLTEYKTDIPNTISMYVKQITDLETDNNNSISKIDVNFFNKKQQTHIKPEKKKEKKSMMINSYSTVQIKNLKMEKNGLPNPKPNKKIENKKKVGKKPEKTKSGKKWEKLVKTKDKDKMFKRKSTSYSISALSEKMNKIKNHLSKHPEFKERSKDEITENNEINSISKSKSKTKSKINIEENDITPNIIIYGSESSSENNTHSHKEKEINENNENNENKNIDNYFVTKNHSDISSGNDKQNEKDDHKIIKPRSKPSSNLIKKFSIKNLKPKKPRMSRKFTSSNITNKIKLNSKYSSTNTNEKEKEKEKDKDKEKTKDKEKDKKKFSIMKLFTSKNIFKEDKENNKIKYRNSVTKHMLSIKEYSQMALKKNPMNSSKDIKKVKKFTKLNSDVNLSLTKEEEFKKKSNKNLRHDELDKSFVKKHSYNSIPRITINTKSQENDTNDVHLVVKGIEETITNYTNQQMIEDEKDYMIRCLKVLAKLKKEEMPRCKQKVNFNFPPEEKQKKIALFDLDETLVHCNNNEPGMNGDVVSVKLPTNKIVKVGLNIRKNWQNALDLIKNHYHVVIYTASHPSYADAVLDYMDKENKYFKYRLYRSHCIQCDVDGFKFYVKDLDTLDKYYNLKDIVIIDNYILSFAYHLYNGIPIIPFINQPNDTELMFTAHYLVSIANYDDLSLENKKHLNLDNLLSMAKILNEIEGSQEEEEEEEDENCIIKTEEVKNPEGDNVNDNGNDSNNNNQDSIKNGGINESKTEGVINFFKKDTGETSGENVKRDNNTERKKFTGRAKVKKDRTTIKIAEDMKKNLDEMLNKKKKELEKIDENK